MLDEKGFDYGILTSVGLTIASAVVLLFIFALFKASAPANTTIALQAAAGEVSGDIETVSSMAVPYSAERYYSFDGINVTVSSDRVTASEDDETFSKPLTTRILPGTYSENGTPLWNGSAGVRECLNHSFHAMGTRDDPVDINASVSLNALMKRAAMSTFLAPVKIVPEKPLLIEKMFIYTCNNYKPQPGGRALRARLYWMSEASRSLILTCRRWVSWLSASLSFAT